MLVQLVLARARARYTRGTPAPPNLSHNLSIFVWFNLDFSSVRRYHFEWVILVLDPVPVLVPQLRGGSAGSAVRGAVRGSPPSPPRPTSLQTPFVWLGSYKNQMWLLMIDVLVLGGTNRWGTQRFCCFCCCITSYACACLRVCSWKSKKMRSFIGELFHIKSDRWNQQENPWNE